MVRQRPAVILDRPLGESLLGARREPLGREDVKGRLGLRLLGYGFRWRQRPRLTSARMSASSVSASGRVRAFAVT